MFASAAGAGGRLQSIPATSPPMPAHISISSRISPLLRAILTSNNDYSSARLNLGWVLFIVIPILGHHLAHKTIAHAVARQYFGAASPADNYFTLWQNNGLAGLAGVGQAATSQNLGTTVPMLSNIGTSQAASNIAGSNARTSGYTGVANALSGYLSNGGAQQIGSWINGLGNSGGTTQSNYGVDSDLARSWGL